MAGTFVVLTLLRAASNRAIADELLERNPAALVRKLSENNVRDRVLDQDEYERLLGVIKSDYLKLIVKVAYETGMRRGEIEGLRWERIDLDAGFINLLPEDTKTNDGRRIPLPDHLLEELRALRAIQGSQTTDIEAMPFVFRRYIKKQGIYRRAGSTKKSFYTAMREAKVEGFHFHDLRHTFVTNMRDKGVDDRTIMSITGHKTMAVFMRYDSGPGDAQLKAAVGSESVDKGQSGIKVVSGGRGTD